MAMATETAPCCGTATAVRSRPGATTTCGATSARTCRGSLPKQVSTHWLRHTTLTWVERTFRYAVARAYAGHSGRNDIGTTMTYVRAEIQEIATALAKLTGESHPLANPSAATAARSLPVPSPTSP